MKFQEAFDKIYDIELQETIRDNPGQNVQIGISPKSAKLLSMVWNLMALADLEDKEDLAFINKHNNIVSVPIEIEEKEEETSELKKTTPKDKKDKSSDKKVTAEGDNGGSSES